MNIEELHADLVARGVRLAAQDGRVRWTAPPGVATSEVVEQMSQHKDALLAHLRVRRVPLSYQQEQLWVDHRLDPGGSAYHEPLRMELVGPLVEAALNQAFEVVLQRHETLRTTYRTHRGRPYQVVQDPAGSPLERVDLTGVQGEDQAEQLDRAVALEVHRAFDLSAGPMLRAVLYRLDDERHQLLITRHHIAADGWSLAVLLRDLGDAYTAARADRAELVATAAVRYSDFAEWQRAVRDRDPLGARGAERVDALRAAPTNLDLPAPASTDLSCDAETVTVRIDRALTDGIAELALRLRTTPFTVLFTAYALAVGRCAGQQDLLLGAPVAGRPRTEYEQVVGSFANLVPVRVRLDKAFDMADLLGLVHAEVLSALSAREVPFAALASALASGRRFEPNPLFQATFTLQNLPGVEVALPGLRTTLLPAPAVAPKYALAALATPDDDGYEIAVVFDPARVRAATARAVAAGCLAVLEAAVADPGRAIADLGFVINAPGRPAGPVGDDRPAPEVPADAPAPTEAVSGAAVTREPSTPTQRRVAQLWRDLLGLDAEHPLDVDTSFFELGGDSIKLTQLLAWSMEAFDVDLPIRRIRELLDIASLAAAIDETRARRPRLAEAELAELVHDVEHLSEEELRSRLR